MEVINELILQAAASPWLLLVMFAAAAIDGFFPPVPSETVLVAAAAVSFSSGDVDVILLCAVAAAGAMVGDNIAYAIGRSLGLGRWAWLRRPRVAAALERAGAALRRRGAPLILGARYIPVGRVAVNMSAGALRYPWRRFLPLSAVGGVTWAVYSAGIGMLAGAWLAGNPLISAILGIAVALLLGVVIERADALRRRRADRIAAAIQTDAGDEVAELDVARMAG